MAALDPMLGQKVMLGFPLHHHDAFLCNSFAHVNLQHGLSNNHNYQLSGLVVEFLP